MQIQFKTIARYFLALILLLVGLNKFFAYLPPMELSEDAMLFMQALQNSGYLIYVIGFFELLSGIFLLTKKCAPIGLLLMAPITVNILLFHLFLNPATMSLALIVSALQLYLFFVFKENFSSILESFKYTSGNKKRPSAKMARV